MRGQIMRLNLGRIGFSRLSLLISLVFSAAVSMLFFQNCAEPMDLSQADDSSTGKYASKPFAYEMQADHLAYMSCSGVSSLDPRAYFSFKVGSYSSNGVSGIGLNSTFLNSMQDASSLDKAEALLSSDANAGTQPQLAIRKKDTLGALCRNTSGSGCSTVSNFTEGKDYDNFLGPLDSEFIVNQMAQLQLGKKANFFNEARGTGTERRFQGQLAFMDSEVLAADVRGKLDYGAVSLVLSYVNVDGETNAGLLPLGYDGVNKAYGKRLDLTFTRGHGVTFGGLGGINAKNIFIGGAKRVLASVSEQGLDGVASSGTWTCPDQLKFLIIRSEDNGKEFFCGTNATTQQPTFWEDARNPPSGVSFDHFKAARNILPLEYWHIDFAKRCVVPKGGGVDACYGLSTFSENPINYKADDTNYDPDADVLTDNLVSMGTSCGAAGQPLCPHYVSICYKSN